METNIDFQFEILSDKKVSTFLKGNNIHFFQSAIAFFKSNLAALDDCLKLVVEDTNQTMTTVAKFHAVLAQLAVENDISEIELVVGIFIVNATSFPELNDYFSDKSYDNLALSTCYCIIDGERIDFFKGNSFLDKISKRFVREQRVDPHQAKEWKEKIYEDYIGKWLKRNSEITETLDFFTESESEVLGMVY